MKRVKKNIASFAVCIDNSGYPVSLELHKIYRVLPDEQAAADDLLRVIDESGEDFLFSAKRFVVIDLPQAVKRAIVQSSKNNDDMLPEYNFKNMKGGVRGKYYKAYRAGHTVKIHKANGTTEVHRFMGKSSEELHNKKQGDTWKS